MQSPAIDLRVERVSKQFGETRALSEVSLGVLPGSVHALVGENGAGKSTLGRIIAGAIRPDAGSVIVDGAAGGLRAAAGRARAWHRAHRTGDRARPLAGRGGEHPARRRAAALGLHRTARIAAPVSAARDRRRLRASRGRAHRGHAEWREQQQVEILRALARDARLIVMDEPTARLSAAEAEKLHATVRALAAGGRSVLLISHFLKEVLDVADTVTVLRDGALVATGPTATATEASLIEAMLGRQFTAQYPDRRLVGAGAPIAARNPRPDRQRLRRRLDSRRRR